MTFLGYRQTIENQKLQENQIYTCCSAEDAKEPRGIVVIHELRNSVNPINSKGTENLYKTEFHNAPFEYRQSFKDHFFHQGEEVMDQWENVLDDILHQNGYDYSHTKRLWIGVLRW